MFTVAASVGEPKESPLAHARGHAFSRPVDTAHPAAHFGVVDKKPHKVEEPQAIYAPKKPAKAAPAVKKAPANTEFDRIANKLLRERRELLHKLAQ